MFRKNEDVFRPLKLEKWGKRKGYNVFKHCKIFSCAVQ